ncbi:MAG: rhodanese-like domain-containing protein [Gemmatimonadetes bacterium]|nr:rhodanese-like domain-containing protein [Gemmatimonadota bacterium]
MIVRRFFDIKLAQTSYLIACGQAGVGVVIDPNRDIDQYVRAAEAEGVRIAHVTETHIHADFISGARALAAQTGATLYLSDEGDENWKYAFAKEAGAVLVRDGDEFSVGNIRVQVVHTPGHTPEHISFVITDRAAADEPIGIVTGDFVFVGDVGRPDLLERAARFEGTMETAARTLFHSLKRFKAYPDWLQIWPGHGAGSACGKGLSAVPHSTVGYEKRFNWAFAIDDEDVFVKAVLEGQPEPPKYFAEMKRLNKLGAADFDFGKMPTRVGVAEIRAALAAGVSVVDTRLAAEFADGHIAGTINIPLNKSFNTWAGWFLRYDAPFLLIAADDGAIREAVSDLAMIGLDSVSGGAEGGVIARWRADGGAVGTIPQISLTELSERMRAGTVSVLDVRGRSEWDAGHLPGVPSIPVGLLPDQLGNVPKSGTLVVHCQGGGRSAIGASVLRSLGIQDVANLPDGFEGWSAAGLPVEVEAPPGVNTPVSH